MVWKKIIGFIAITILFFAKDSEELCNSTVGVTTCENETPQPGKPLNITNYKRLLTFAEGNIEEIPSGTFKLLPELNILLLTHNEISKLENDSFDGLPEMVQLSLYKNKLEELPSNLFKGCQNLKVLDLGKNELKKIDANVLEDLLVLEELNLGFNKLKSVPGKLKQLKSLKIVKLNNNEIEKLNPKQFAKMAKLEILYLNDNKISQIPNEAFMGLTSLNQLNLVNNSLENYREQYYMDDLFVVDFKALSAVKLNPTWFHCDTLEAIVNNLRKNSIAEAIREEK